MSCLGAAGHILWRKSRYSIANGDCLEAASSAGGIMLRDSGDPAGSVLRYSAMAWQAFVDVLKDADHPATGPAGI